MSYRIKVNISNNLLLFGSLEQRGHDGEAALGDGREKQSAKLWEACSCSTWMQ
jgi:hypothetical protein